VTTFLAAFATVAVVLGLLAIWLGCLFPSVSPRDACERDDLIFKSLGTILLVCAAIAAVAALALERGL
jgi:hypothetical protein